DAVVEVTLIGEQFDFLGPRGEAWSRATCDDDYEEDAYLEEDDLRGLVESETATRLRRFLNRVLEGLGLSARVRITETPEELRAEVSGDDLGIFIGRRGQTIDAVEYLASIAVFPEAQGKKHVEIDAEGYKERRRKQIERIALSKAQEAVRRGKPVQLPPMTSAERKIVHVVLKERRDVTTASQGREPNRAVVITPVR
ncbi:MAG: KH domain-containing protein, partial [Thermoleophilia bacterium]|nr:KH domain-containing protein [Thermoleophilia bacterium]